MGRSSRPFRTILGVLLIGAFAGIRPAAARGTDGSWEAGAYYFITHPDQESKIQDVNGGGLRVGWYRKATQEFELDYDSGSKIDSIRLPGVTFDVSKLSALYVRNYQPKGHDNLSPILLFGLGQISINNGTKTSDEFLLRAGGGFKYFFSPHVAARFDASIFSWYGDGDTVPLTRLYAFDTNVGISILFGGKK